ncbi:DUF1249 domain-containing protein [Thiobaca trueperi]|uniref:DUF1249 domain-containing protein n=1 Tax=Thiobaca trueperi TaxID=127458 RepID=A0A4R3N4Y1_9GAMM|nr:DUF1249 domain-containing protein [Thiobaca trueperi]TCT24065.1 hypothetical protein EDC35_101385 [Thiobaca trueperi]
MQRPWHPCSAPALLLGRPNVGALMSLCEENYGLLRRLAPRLRHDAGRLTSHRPGCLDLHLEIQEQARYTTQVRLTYFFEVSAGVNPHPEPDARLRIYHDACQVELLDLRQSLWSRPDRYRHPALLDKWQANLFLAKWLTFCLDQGHCFDSCARLTASTSGGHVLMPACTEAVQTSG